nr:3294_t:CDS:2 [Entrophospora candida]
MVYLKLNSKKMRNIAIVGHVHHGKTSFVDMLIYETHNPGAWDVDKQVKDHGVNIKGMPITLVLQNTKEKSYPFNIPGHADFVDEATAELRLADDAIKGANWLLAMVNTEYIIKHIIQKKLSLTLVVNKVNRLILESRLLPNDAHFKLKHTIEEVNTVIRTDNKVEVSNIYKSGGSYFHALLSQDNNKILNSRIRKNFFLKDNKNLVIKTMKIFDSDTSDNIKRGNSAISSCEITVVRMYKRSSPMLNACINAFKKNERRTYLSTEKFIENLLYEYMPQNIWRHNFILDSDNYFYANGKRFTKNSDMSLDFHIEKWCNVNLWELILDQYFPDILDVEEVREESSS